jgi:hypothetical protein
MFVAFTETVVPSRNLNPSGTPLCTPLRCLPVRPRTMDRSCMVTVRANTPRSGSANCCTGSPSIRSALAGLIMQAGNCAARWCQPAMTARSGDDAAPGGGVRQSRRCAINRRGHAAMDAGTAHRRANGGCLCPGMVQAVAPTQRSPSRPCRPLAMLYARARGTVLTAMLRDGRGGDQGGGARQCLITGVTDFDLPP